MIGQNEYAEQVYDLMGEENEQLYEDNFAFIQVGHMKGYPAEYTAEFIMEQGTVNV